MGTRRSFVVVCVAVAALAAGPVTAQVDVTAIGPQVGQKAIEFRLVDQNGQPQTLASAAGSKGTMLVFFRSADW